MELSHTSLLNPAVAALRLSPYCSQSFQRLKALFGVNILTLLLISSVLHISPVASEAFEDLDFLVARFSLARSWPLHFSFCVISFVLYTFLDFPFSIALLYRFLSTARYD